MIAPPMPHTDDLAQRLAEAEATIEALLSGQIDAVVDSSSKTPVLLSKAQAALRESEERYHRIVETATEGIWAIDENARTTFVNGQMARMVGYSVEEMMGEPMADFVGEADRNRAVLMVERGRQGISRSGKIPRFFEGTALRYAYESRRLRSPVRMENTSGGLP